MSLIPFGRDVLCGLRQIGVFAVALMVIMYVQEPNEAALLHFA